jgi:DnaK suppressor protein
MAAAKKAPAKKAAKTAAKKAAPKKVAPKKAPAKKAAAKKASAVKGKVVKKPTTATRGAKGAPAKPSRPAAKVPAKAPVKPTKVVAKALAKAAEKPAPKKSPPRPAKVERAPVSFAPAPIGARAPAPAAPRPVPAPSPKDLAAAHEYLLARSATRSEEPVLVNGRRLPTEGELLKMSESAYMNEQQLAFFKYRLQEMERELLQNADETTEHLRETVIVPDPADRATIEEEHALERKLLKKVQQSLARIEAGDYGYCEETGDPIGIPRLLARPTATLSLEAQQRREIKQKMFGD